jgi:hypothetical protein
MPRGVACMMCIHTIIQLSQIPRPTMTSRSAYVYLIGSAMYYWIASFFAAWGWGIMFNMKIFIIAGLDCKKGNIISDLIATKV